MTQFQCGIAIGMLIGMGIYAGCNILLEIVKNKKRVK